MKKVAFQTLGCKLNFAETSTIGRQFIERGFDIVDADMAADVFIFNTCSVTERADRECRQLIRRTLRRSPNTYIIVVGCYSQLQPDEIATIDGVDLILGTKEKFNIFHYTNGFTKKGIPQVFVSCVDEEMDFNPAFSAEVGGRTRAFLKVQDGCDYNCAFCTIPLARGESRSSTISDVVRQANLIADQGYKEIVLTGVNVGDYGKKSGTSLLELMKTLEHAVNIERIRISSIEPNILTKKMVDFVLKSEKFCNHFHIPLQSGSDLILKNMRRRYLTHEYQKLITYIRDMDPNAGIGADVIVGFPGETEKLFDETKQFLSDLPLSYLHIFTYSKRANTLAAAMPVEVEPRIRSVRSELLHKLGAFKRYAFNNSFLGETLPVLFEGKIHDGSFSGLTSNYIRVETKSNNSVVNKIFNVKISSVKEEHCVGEIIDFQSPNPKSSARKFESSISI